MSKVGLVFLVAQILVLQAMAQVSEAPLPGPNPLEHKTRRGVQLTDEKTDKIADQPVGSSTVTSSQEKGQSKAEAAAEAPGIRRLGKHHSTDKSVAGGGVIIGGLVTAIFAAVFCYIRVTRKRDTGY